MCTPSRVCIDFHALEIPARPQRSDHLLRGRRCVAVGVFDDDGVMMMMIMVMMVMMVVMMMMTMAMMSLL